MHMQPVKQHGWIPVLVPVNLNALMDFLELVCMQPVIRKKYLHKKLNLYYFS